MQFWFFELNSVEEPVFEMSSFGNFKFWISKIFYMVQIFGSECSEQQFCGANDTENGFLKSICQHTCAQSSELNWNWKTMRDETNVCTAHQKNYYCIGQCIVCNVYKSAITTKGNKNFK